jgi:hypothetical protein
MTPKTKLTVRALAHYHGLRIKYVSDLPATVPGFLDPSKASRTIVVNANKSRSDHAFTILHEIDHFILHFERSHRIRLPWYLTRQWKWRPVIRFSKLFRRAASRKLNDEYSRGVSVRSSLAKPMLMARARKIIAGLRAAMERPAEVKREPLA